MIDLKKSVINSLNEIWTFRPNNLNTVNNINTA